MEATKLNVLVNGERCELEVLRLERDSATFKIGDRTYEVELEKSLPQSSSAPTNKNSQSALPKSSGADGEVCAPIPGVVVAILVKPGDKLAEGDLIFRLEAMKMENNIFAPQAGVVKEILVEEGHEVLDGQILLRLDV